MNISTAIIIFINFTYSGNIGTVAMSLANGLVGTGFASQYQLEPRAGF